MTPTLRRAPTAIGVDLGARTIRAAQLAPGTGVAASLSLPRLQPDDPITGEEIHDLAAILRRRGFRGQTVAITPPKPCVQTAMIELPPVDSGAPLSKIAAAEFARARRVPPGSFELTWWTPVGAGPPARGRVIAAACGHELSNAMIDAWEDAGFRVAVLAPGPSALAHALASFGDAAELDRPEVIVDLGWTSCDVTISIAGVPAFYRAVRSAGFGPAHDACVEKTNATLEQAAWMLGAGREEAPEIAAVVSVILAEYGAAVASVIQTTLAYARECWRGAPIDRVYLTGGGAMDAELFDWLEANTGVTLVPFPSPWGLDASFAGAVGLARHAVPVTREATRHDPHETVDAPEEVAA